MRAQAPPGAEKNYRSEGRKSRSQPRAGDRHLRSAQNASTRSSRRNLEERLQTRPKSRVEEEKKVEHRIQISVSAFGVRRWMFGVCVDSRKWLLRIGLLTST